MSTPTVDVGADPIRGGGWRVHRDDGTVRTVLPRLSGDGFAVFTGMSTVDSRVPALGFPGSWRQSLEAAIEWARTEAGVSC